jgi:anti-sigma B factor antagonist
VAVSLLFLGKASVISLKLEMFLFGKLKKIQFASSLFAYVLMNIQQQHQSVLIQSPDRLDLEGGASLRRKLSTLEPKRHSLWIVDLAQVDFIDSAGLVALIGGLNLARKHQCRLVFHNPRPAVKVVFEITRLNQVFEVIENCLEAVTASDKTPARSLSRPVAA